MEEVQIKWRDAESSNIKRVGWAEGERWVAVFIVFHKGGIYMYMGMTRQRAMALVQAESPGRYFHKHIKKK